MSNPNFVFPLCADWWSAELSLLRDAVGERPNPEQTWDELWRQLDQDWHLCGAFCLWRSNAYSSHGVAYPAEVLRVDPLRVSKDLGEPYYRILPELLASVIGSLKVEADHIILKRRNDWDWLMDRLFYSFGLPWSLVEQPGSLSSPEDVDKLRKEKETLNYGPSPLSKITPGTKVLMTIIDDPVEPECDTPTIVEDKSCM